MINDSLRVALLSVTLEGSTPHRRRAALILLDLAGSSAAPDFGPRRIAAVRSEAGPAVAAEIQALIEELGVARVAEGV
ncbi:MAG: hypothetical protein H0T75_24075 [Rhizobiales bacterium]|nr:hypothetical protein [Hyphomicrobiales bacterium]MDQ3559389.1 hypothetical protein [Pseudomonadota bacterium]